MGIPWSVTKKADVELIHAGELLADEVIR